MSTADWVGIIGGLTALLGSIGLGAKWLITFITEQANKTNELLRAQNEVLTDRVAVLEVKLDACEKARAQ